MHTMWKGSISFGLVNVPVRMFAATESKDIKFRYLHKECNTPIQYTRTCPRCDKQVDWTDIVRGFEYAPDQFVILDEDDLAQFTQKRSHTIDISEFVNLSDIDPIYYDKTYYLAPEATGSKAYRLLMTAMEQSGRIAIAKTVLRNTETLACLRVNHGVMMMETLFWPDEVRSTEELPNLRVEANVTEQELTMATTLIDQLATTFAPARYNDTHRDDLMEAITAKVQNQEVTAAPVARPTENIVDLMEALQASIKATKPAKKSARRKTS